MKAYQVTLTTADTNYSLLTLVRAIDSVFVDHGKVVSIQVAPAAESAAGNVRFGDSNVSDTRYGYILGNQEGKIYDGGGHTVMSLLNLYARPDTSGMKVNIEVTH